MITLRLWLCARRGGGAGDGGGGRDGLSDGDASATPMDMIDSAAANLLVAARFAYPRDSQDAPRPRPRRR